MSKEIKQVTVEPRGGAWVVRIFEDGKSRDFCCATERMARQLAAVFGRADYLNLDAA